MLTKRAEECEKVKETHKYCDYEYKKLKDKYSDLLNSYHELKKSNINLVRENNTSKTKLKGLTTGNSLTSTIDHIVGYHDLSMNKVPSFCKNKIPSTPRDKNTIDESLISEIKGGHMESTGNSEMSIDFDLDLTASVDGSSIIN